MGHSSSVGPSLAFFAGQLWAAWKGEGSDQTLWYATYNGTSRSGRTQIQGATENNLGGRLLRPGPGERERVLNGWA
jgi:hypothetical protein